MSDIDGPGEGSESPPPEPQRGGNRGLSGSAKVREVCLKEEKKIFRAIQKSLFAIEDCQKKECGHEPLGKVKLPEFVGFLIQPTGEIVTLLTGMWKQGMHDEYGLCFFSTNSGSAWHVQHAVQVPGMTGCSNLSLI